MTKRDRYNLPFPHYHPFVISDLLARNEARKARIHENPRQKTEGGNA